MGSRSMRTRSRRVLGALAGVVLFSTGQATAAPPAVEWSISFGGPSYDAISDVVAVDGGAIAVGQSWAGLDGSRTYDAFVRAVDTTGAELWTDEFGTSATDAAYSVAELADGSIAVGGLTAGALGGPSSGSLDLVVRRYSLSGAVLTTQQFGTAGVDALRGVAALADDVVVVGFTTGTFPGQTNAGGYDGFVARWNPATATVVWARQFGTPEQDLVYDVAVADGRVFVAGVTRGNLLGPSAGSDDALLMTYDADGTLLWGDQFGTDKAENAVAVTVDATGRPVVAGNTAGGLGGPQLSPNDGFVRTYAAPTGPTVAWTSHLGVVGGYTYAYDVEAAIGGVVVAGHSKNNAWATALDEAGQVRWELREERAPSESHNSVATRAGAIYLGGGSGTDGLHGNDARLGRVVPDTDDDGLNDADELAHGTDPTQPDTDGDGLTDGDEVHVYGTDPTDPDTDGDCADDGEEVDAGTDPTAASPLDTAAQLENDALTGADPTPRLACLVGL